jgi:hypothetical protein
LLLLLLLLLELELLLPLLPLRLLLDAWCCKNIRAAANRCAS